jgi:hypothetical protein
MDTPETPISPAPEPGEEQGGEDTPDQVPPASTPEERPPASPGEEPAPGEETPPAMGAGK